MLHIRVKSLAEILQMARDGEPSLKGATGTTIRGRVPSEIRSPVFQSGSTECPPVKNFSYPELIQAEFQDAIITKSGAVIVGNQFLIEETVEGPLHANQMLEADAECSFDDTDIDIHAEPAISFCKFGIFNYSIFLTEIMPCACLLSLLPGFSDRAYYMDFAGFMSEQAVALRWHALSACGFQKARSFTTAKNGVRVKSVGVVKVNDRYKNHRASQLAPVVASVLRGACTDSQSVSPRRIYIRRSGHTARKVENYDDLAVMLERFGVESHALEDMPIEKQINLFSKADFVMGEHGAGLVNTMFMRPGASVLEVFPEPLVGRWAFRLVSHAFNLSYNFNSFRVPAGWNWSADNVTVNLASLEAALQRIGAAA